MNKLSRSPVQGKLSVVFLREGRRFVAYAPALDLSTSGKSFEEVKKRFEEITQIFFEELARKGTTKEVLGSLGWGQHDRTWDPPLVIGHESQTIRLPVFS
ncbi:MAG: hypothetical protein HY006_01780 [Candidatus Sungbacteria bacterium]|nr:hypothetical protein [Candidatus Sungbacteria bacterium]